MAGAASMQTETFIGSGSGKNEPRREIDRGLTRRNLDVPMTCCGKPMTPQFRHARDHDGQMLFVAVWRCPVCARVTF